MHDSPLYPGWRRASDIRSIRGPYVLQCTKRGLRCRGTAPSAVSDPTSAEGPHQARSQTDDAPQLSGEIASDREGPRVQRTDCRAGIGTEAAV